MQDNPATKCIPGFISVMAISICEPFKSFPPPNLSFHVGDHVIAPSNPAVLPCCLQWRYHARCRDPPMHVAEKPVDGAVAPSGPNVDFLQVLEFSERIPNVPLVEISSNDKVRISICASDLNDKVLYIFQALSGPGHRVIWRNVSGHHNQFSGRPPQVGHCREDFKFLWVRAGNFLLKKQ